MPCQVCSGVVARLVLVAKHVQHEAVENEKLYLGKLDAAGRRVFDPWTEGDSFFASFFQLRNGYSGGNPNSLVCIGVGAIMGCTKLLAVADESLLDGGEQTHRLGSGEAVNVDAQCSQWWPISASASKGWPLSST